MTPLVLLLRAMAFGAAVVSTLRAVDGLLCIYEGEAARRGLFGPTCLVIVAEASGAALLAAFAFGVGPR